MLVCDLTQFYSPVGGGVRRYLSEKRKHLELMGHRHLLIVPGERTERYEEGSSITYTIESALISRTARYRALTNLALIEEALEREKPNIIESGDPYQVAWKTIASGRCLGIPTVGFYHSHFPEATVHSVAKYFGSISQMIAGEIAQRYVVALYNQFQQTIVPNPNLTKLLASWGVENAITRELGVDTTIFFPDAERQQKVRHSLKFDKERKLLLFVGRLSPEKNVRTLMAAFGHLHESNPKAYHLMVIGDGPLRGALQRLQEKTGQVTWHSYCDNAVALADYYRAADLFVHPGVQETFGLVTLESQACGTPVLSIQGSSMDPIIFTELKHGAKKNNSLSLAEAIASFCTLELEILGATAATLVRDRYTWKNVFERLFDIYGNVIDSYNP